jgi:DNA (cytosine-5)-methyltransferase 1
LLWEVERLLEETKEKPQILLMENVPEVINQKNLPDFQEWVSKLTKLGYSNFYKVLNAKDYGIPQNRRRCFMISILGDYAYEFPRKVKLKYCLENFLETSVDEKYFLNDKDIERIASWNAFEKPLENMIDTSKQKTVGTITTHAGKDSGGMKLVKVGNYGNGYFSKNVYDHKGLSPTLTCGNHGLGTAISLPIKENTKQGYKVAEKGDGINISGRMGGQRGNVQKGLCQTLKTSCDVGVIDDNKN